MRPTFWRTFSKKLKNDFALILSSRFFYSLRPELNELYGKPMLFGEEVAKKFAAANKDIEGAGNCLALGEPTACVLHLNRVMEVAVRKLANKLHVMPEPADTVGAVLRDVRPAIAQLPENTGKLKRKKELWAECRALLFDVKNAWRDPSSYGKVSYNDREA